MLLQPITDTLVHKISNNVYKIHVGVRIKARVLCAKYSNIRKHNRVYMYQSLTQYTEILNNISGFGSYNVKVFLEIFQHRIFQTYTCSMWSVWAFVLYLLFNYVW